MTTTTTSTPIDTATATTSTGAAVPATSGTADDTGAAPDATRRPSGGILDRIRRRRPRRRRRSTVPPLGPYRLAAPSSLDLSAMGARIAEAGPAASPALLAEVARRAGSHGVTSSAVGLLTDPGVPDVVRTRAFAVVSNHLTTTAPPRRREVAA